MYTYIHVNTCALYLDTADSMVQAHTYINTYIPCIHMSIHIYIHTYIPYIRCMHIPY